MQMTEQYKYFAFISYSSKDIKWGKKLHKKLENYRLPATICRKKSWKRKPIDPVFFAPYEIQPGDLPEELKKRLRQSRNLIVICSPNSAQSDWVAKEIAYFNSLNRPNSIFFFIIDGIPHSKEKEYECLNPIVDKLGMPEILGVNINEKVYRWPWLNKERAFVQLVTKLLGIEFDTIWQRHKRMLVQRAISGFILVVLFVCAIVVVHHTSTPVDIIVSLKEESNYNSNLPQLKDAHITLFLKDSTSREIIIPNVNEKGIFKNIPYENLNNKVRVKVTCLHYNNIDGWIKLSSNIELVISRDENFYGDIHFELWDSKTNSPVRNFPVNIEGYNNTTNEYGQISFFIPLNKQKKVYYPIATNFIFLDSIVMPIHKEHIHIIEGYSTED